MIFQCFSRVKVALIEKKNWPCLGIIYWNVHNIFQILISCGLIKRETILTVF